LEECRLNSKSFSNAFLTAILLSSLILVSVAVGFVPVQASTGSIPKPSVPEFTVTLEANPYYVPPTYSIDEYTGENVTTQGGYYVENKSIIVRIKNQPFSYSNNGLTYHLYYNVRTKPHFAAEDWTELCFVTEQPNSPYDWDAKSWSYSTYLYPNYQRQSDSDYTVVSYALGGDGYYLFKGLPPAAQIDFQVETIVGHDSQLWYIEHPFTPEYGGHYEPAVAVDERSGWSDTKAITIPASAPSPTIMPTPTPTPVPTPISVPGQTSFSVESNSTVTNLFFNSTSSELSFTVNGTTGTAGYVTVTVAKSIVSSIQNVKTYLDGSELSVSITSDETSWFLSFNYLHSTHNVKINLATSTDSVTFMGLDFLVGLGVGLGIAVVGVCLLFYLKRRNC
jgi:hypothetical protein